MYNRDLIDFIDQLLNVLEDEIILFHYNYQAEMFYRTTTGGLAMQK